jgi:hypothetical protein
MMLVWENEPFQRHDVSVNIAYGISMTTTRDGYLKCISISPSILPKLADGTSNPPVSHSTRGRSVYGQQWKQSQSQNNTRGQTPNRYSALPPARRTNKRV